MEFKAGDAVRFKRDHYNTALYYGLHCGPYDVAHVFDGAVLIKAFGGRTFAFDPACFEPQMMEVLDDHDIINERAGIERELRAQLEALIALTKQQQAILEGEDAADFDDPESPIAAAIDAIHNSKKRSPFEWPSF